MRYSPVRAIAEKTEEGLKGSGGLNVEVHETCLIAPKYFWDQRRVLLMRVLLTGLLPLAHLRTLHSEGARESMRMRHPVHPDANLSVRFVQLYDTRALSQRVAGNQSAMTVAFTTRSCYPNGSGAASRTRPCAYLTIPPKTRLTLSIHPQVIRTVLAVEYCHLRGSGKRAPLLQPDSMASMLT